MPVVILPDSLTQPVGALLAILGRPEPAEAIEPAEAETVVTTETADNTAAANNGPNWALVALAAVAGIAAGVAAVRIFNKKRHANL